MEQGCEVVDTLDLFFFQAEDGIRDIGVTGVQTCALPISFRRQRRGRDLDHHVTGIQAAVLRSEERRVGKECRSRWSPDPEKKNQRASGRRTTSRGPPETGPAR